jgi:hypothetical protein
VTAVEIDAGGGFKAILTDGDAELGGSNYDEVILELMRKEAKRHGIEISPEKDLATFCQNLERAREAKEMLSRREEVTVIAEADGKRVPIKLTRKILRQADGLAVTAGGSVFRHRAAGRQTGDAADEAGRSRQCSVGPVRLGITAARYSMHP